METLANALLGISAVCNWYLSACSFSLLQRDAAVYMPLYVLDHFRPIVVSLDQ